MTEFHIVVAVTDEEACFWRDHLGLPHDTPICTTPGSLHKRRAEVVHVCGRRPAELPFAMHHAITWVRRPKPHGREYPEVVFH